MTTPRALCLAAVLPDNRLMVVGGYTGPLVTKSVIQLNSVEWFS